MTALVSLPNVAPGEQRLSGSGPSLQPLVFVRALSGVLAPTVCHVYLTADTVVCVGADVVTTGAVVVGTVTVELVVVVVAVEVVVVVVVVVVVAGGGAHPAAWQ
jgi:hypothetical protein